MPVSSSHFAPYFAHISGGNPKLTGEMPLQKSVLVPLHQWVRRQVGIGCIERGYIKSETLLGKNCHFPF